MVATSMVSRRFIAGCTVKLPEENKRQKNENKKNDWNCDPHKDGGVVWVGADAL